MLISDANVVKRLKKKDEKALDYIISNYGGLIKSIVNKHLYQFKELQDECINDILLAIWDNIDKFCEEKNSFKNWLAAIAKYKAIDYKRKQLSQLEKESISENSLQSTLNPDIMVLENEVSHEIAGLLDNLKPEDRELFIKYYIQEKDMNTIVQETGVKSSVVYNRLSRGRRKLRTLFVNSKV